MLYRVSQRLDYFGNPANWIPTLSINTIIDTLDKTLLGGLGSLGAAEKAYSAVMDAM